MTKKTCSRCHLAKPLSEFSKFSAKCKRRSRDGYRYACRRCEMADTRNWQTRNRDKMREINRKWHAANRDKSNYAKRAARLGMTADELEAFLLKTKNRCMICGKRAKAAEKFHIDHDHKDRAVRGLLCLSCNVGIGFFLDNPVLLQKAIAYLQSAERFSATAGPKNTKPGRRRAAG